LQPFPQHFLERFVTNHVPVANREVRSLAERIPIAVSPGRCYFHQLGGVAASARKIALESFWRVLEKANRGKAVWID
jgi:hypothetical protein